MIRLLQQYVERYPDLSDSELAKKVTSEHSELLEDYKEDSIRRKISFLRELPPDLSKIPPRLLRKALEEFILEKKLVKKKEILSEFNIDYHLLDDIVIEMKLRGYNIQADDEFIRLLPFTIDLSHRQINIDIFDDNWLKFGALGDTHLGSYYERLDILNALYDIYAKEGITTVFHCGNWIAGESRLNQHEVKVHGVDGQIEYFVDNYPFREGITTYFISGDDHEGWWQREDGFRNLGLYAQYARESGGKHDLKYLGYLEANVDIIHPRTKAKSDLRLTHPGGGTAYAVSYQIQKLIESYINDKPQILLVGHYHKYDKLFYRNVWAVQTACIEDQSVFMRKGHNQAILGGCIIWVNQAPDGSINRFRDEFIPFFDEKYYERRGYFRQPQEMVLK
jgi:predicted phosphodiesterase